MFENLIESKRKKQKSLGQSITSVIVHILIIFGAVKATSGAAETLKNVIQDTTDGVPGAAEGSGAAARAASPRGGCGCEPATAGLPGGDAAGRYPHRDSAGQFEREVRPAGLHR
jgi:hypothetical protein